MSNRDKLVDMLDEIFSKKIEKFSADNNIENVFSVACIDFAGKSVVVSANVNDMTNRIANAYENIAESLSESCTKLLRKMM